MYEYFDSNQVKYSISQLSRYHSIVEIVEQSLLYTQFALCVPSCISWTIPCLALPSVILQLPASLATIHFGLVAECGIDVISCSTIIVGLSFLSVFLFSDPSSIYIFIDQYIDQRST